MVSHLLSLVLGSVMHTVAVHLSIWGISQFFLYFTPVSFALL